jgi:hypothetical protein
MLKKRLATLAVSGTLAFVGVAATSVPAQAATSLGGVSVLGACNNQLFTNSVALIASNVSGWRCRYQGATFSVIYYWYNINLNQECAREYGAGAYAGYLNYYDPYSWRCFR